MNQSTDGLSPYGDQTTTEEVVRQINAKREAIIKTAEGAILHWDVSELILGLRMEVEYLMSEHRGATLTYVQPLAMGVPEQEIVIDGHRYIVNL